MMGIAYNTSIVRDGLVLHLDAANPKSYTGSGTNWTDLSGNGYGGSLNGSVLLENSPLPVFNINAENITTPNYLSTASTIEFADQSEYSFDFYVKLRQTAQSTLHSLAGRGATTPWLIIRTNNTVGDSWDLRYREMDLTYRNSYTMSYNIQQNWGNITVTTSANRTISFYLNGEFVQTLPTPNSTEFIVNRLGGGYSSSGNFYSLQGLLGSSMIYSRALSATEVKQNFEALRGRYGL